MVVTLLWWYPHKPDMVVTLFDDILTNLIWWLLFYDDILTNLIWWLLFLMISLQTWYGGYSFMMISSQTWYGGYSFWWYPYKPDIVVTLLWWYPHKPDMVVTLFDDILTNLIWWLLFMVISLQTWYGGCYFLWWYPYKPDAVVILHDDILTILSYSNIIFKSWNDQFQLHKPEINLTLFTVIYSLFAVVNSSPLIKLNHLIYAQTSKLSSSV